MTTPFRPHPLMRGAHAQTALPALFRPSPFVDWRLDHLETQDGDVITVGHFGPEDGPVLALLHGLGGCLESTYLCATARRMAARGWHCVGVQQRGAGPTPNRLARSYNHGASDDIAWILQQLAARHPKVTRAAVGWSLGGNVLLKTLGEMGARAPVDGAVAVSVPFRLAPCVEHLQTGTARVYQVYLLKNLKAAVRRKHGPVPLPPGADVEKALAAKCFRDFDNAYTAPCNDYADADDYYARASCGQYLSGVTIPTRIIHALDDPMMVPSIVPEPDTLPANIELDLHERGGHVGFVSRNNSGLPQMWLEHIIGDWLEARLGAPEAAQAAELESA
ncbi:alpha/beta fold hydrolase [Algiphilus sp. NNCM1]|nr:alpha/beta fold hydrolase [Algiphilus acroporae]MCI5063186.1 alpha/beta fold hydrolase [Algiphilus sp.]